MSQSRNKIQKSKRLHSSRHASMSYTRKDKYRNGAIVKTAEFYTVVNKTNNRHRHYVHFTEAALVYCFLVEPALPFGILNNHYIQEVKYLTGQEGEDNGS